MLRILDCSALVCCALVLAPIGNPGNAQERTGPGESPESLSTNDWVGIQEAYQSSRHAARPVADGYLARNPGQQWETRFDGRGFTTRPDSGGWEWGLELERYGFPERARLVADPSCVQVSGSRVAYEWDETLEEWYVNDERGLEHGYTVRERPAHGTGLLTFRIAVRGTLRPEAHAGGLGVSFVDRDGALAVTYAGLTVFDATGDALPAWLDVDSEGLLLSVDESHARYPITIDPLAQQAYLKASNTDAGDSFGSAVSVSGDTVVVGARGEDSSATGVNGNQGNNSASFAGAVYVFVRNGDSTWSQQAYLKASNTEAFDQFGSSVSVSGNTIVVGARGERSGATGVNGDQSDNSANFAGAAYVFARKGTTWSQQAYLKASNTGVNDTFGLSVSVSGDTVAVGALDESSGATGIDGDQNDNSATAAGAVYVFVRGEDSTWAQEAYLKASNTDAFDQFGSSVSVSGDTIVVGARGEGSSATGVNGNQGNNGAGGSGAAYVFVRDDETGWAQQAYLKASNTGFFDQFGSSVSVSGDTVVVGAYLEDSGATGVNGSQSDLFPDHDAGAAYVFVRGQDSTWSQQAYLKASNPDVLDFFGSSVAVSDDTIVVGASYEDSGSTGVNGDQGGAGIDSDLGAAYVFQRSNGSTWSQRAYLKASNSELVDQFGQAVAVSRQTVVVGAHFESSSATGVNGDQGDNSALEAGAAYVFDSLCAGLVPSTETIRLGAPPNPAALQTGQTYGPLLGTTWDPRIDHTTFLPGALIDVLALGAAPTNIPSGLGTILCFPAVASFPALPGAPFAIVIPPDCGLVGAAACWQGVSWDGSTIGLTNALDTTIGTF